MEPAAPKTAGYLRATYRLTRPPSDEPRIPFCAGSVRARYRDRTKGTMPSTTKVAYSSAAPPYVPRFGIVSTTCVYSSKRRGLFGIATTRNGRSAPEDTPCSAASSTCQLPLPPPVPKRFCPSCITSTGYPVALFAS